MHYYRLPPAQRAFTQLMESMLICLFVTGMLSIVPLISARALNWEQIGFIFLVSSLFSLSHAAVELVRPIPQETERAVDEVMRRFEQRLNTIQAPASWSSGPYPVMPPIQQQAMHHQTTQKVPAVTFPNTAWQPSSKPTQQMPAMPRAPQTSQQYIVRRPHHFQI